MFAGDGAGGFSRAGELALETAAALAVVAADFTADGRTDLLVSSHWEDPLRPNELYLYVSVAGFSFAPPQRFMSRDRPWASISALDVNGDGRPDLIVSPNGLNVSVLLVTETVLSPTLCLRPYSSRYWRASQT